MSIFGFKRNAAGLVGLYDKIGAGVAAFTVDGGTLETKDGLTFPAVQVPCANVNTLDAYEEGHNTTGWIPTIAFGGVGVTGITYGTQYGTYVKIGRAVFYSGQITLTSKGTDVGQIYILGLPFVSAADITHPASFQARTTSFADQITVNQIPGTATLRFYQSSNAGVLSVLDDTSLANNSVLFFAGHYFI